MRPAAQAGEQQAEQDEPQVRQAPHAPSAPHARQDREADYLIVGGGIVGLAIARELNARFPGKRIILVEKEAAVAGHASGRNSGVLHAGFYYTADSLKARFCRDGNRAMTEYVTSRGLRYNPCRKVVVARDEGERQVLHELKRRGDANGVETHLVGERELADIEPNANTCREALYSPATATVDPQQVCSSIARELAEAGVTLLTAHPYRRRLDAHTVLAGSDRINAGKVVNAAGLYADRVAADFGFGGDYTIVPFKGVYLKYTRPDPPLRTNVYPVPNLANPFLGVHFTITVDGQVKIGPTAIPALWRENYRGLSRFRPGEFAAIVGWEAKLFATNAFNFRALALEEVRKYSRRRLVRLAMPMVKRIDPDGFTRWGVPGIRAQLLRKQSLELVQDFIVEGDAASTHVLNAISPAFTCSFPFAKWVVEHHIAPC